MFRADRCDCGPGSPSSMDLSDTPDAGPGRNDVMKARSSRCDKGETALINGTGQAPGEQLPPSVAGPGPTEPRLLAPIAAAVIAGLYLLYLAHFSTNFPIADEWSVVRLVHVALHGHLTWKILWAQHFESRMLFPNLIFVAAGFVDRYDLRAIILLAGLLLIASYVLLLVLTGRYLGRRLTVLPTMLLGIVWFSLADVQNALWGFQVAWYLVLFCFIAVLYLLLVSGLPRAVALILTVAAAVVASYSSDQGLLLWPVGLLVLLWGTPWTRRTYAEAAVWVLATLTTIWFYLWRFNLDDSIGLCGRKCTLGFEIHHPWQVVSYTLRLVGSVVPTKTSADTVAYELLGLGLLVAACFVIVQSIRERRNQRRIPLPLALITFALLFDVLIVIGRSGGGYHGQSEYVMPQLVLLSALVVYGAAHAHFVPWPPDRTERVAALGYLTVIVVVVLQFLTATNWGFATGSRIQRSTVLEARLAVNFSDIPASEQQCYETKILAARARDQRQRTTPTHLVRSCAPTGGGPSKRFPRRPVSDLPFRRSSSQRCQGV